MTKHIGNMTVTAENALSFPAITEFYGHLTIAAGATLRANDLVSIRGWLTIDGTLHAPRLGKIDGWLTVRTACLNAENLDEVTRDVVLENPDIFAKMTKVGSLTLKSDTSDLSWLETIGTFLTVGAGAHVNLPVLQRVGSITVKPNAVLNAPALARIDGYADIDESATLVAPRFLS
jgi:hypothetical protein